jgi:hypothetical protein
MMTHLRLAKLAVIAAPLALFFAACSSSPSSGSAPTPTDVGGAESTSASTGSWMGQGGGEDDVDAAPPLMDAMLVDAASACSGDIETWKKLTSIPSACQDDAECCVIMSPCDSGAQIVGAAHMNEALAAWPFCPWECNDCVPPAIEVACVLGQCRGYVVLESKFDSPLRANHCAADIKILPSMESTDIHFGCGG